MEAMRLVVDVEVKGIDFAAGKRLDAGDLDRLGRLKPFVLALDDAMIDPHKVQMLGHLVNQLQPVHHKADTPALFYRLLDHVAGDDRLA
jgi:hypothetical protein